MIKLLIKLTILALAVIGFFFIKSTYFTPEEVTIPCQEFGIVSASEWEIRGFTIENNIAKGEQGEFNINEKEICLDTTASLKALGMDCESKCNSTGYKLDFLIGITTCYCS